jgi:uncharacterized protein
MQAMDHKNVNSKHAVAGSDFADIVAARLTRRQLLAGGLSATTAAIFSSGWLAGCSRSDLAPPLNRPTLGFPAVAKTLADIVTLPAGYDLNVLYATGDPFRSTDPAWSDAGTETGSSYEFRAGDHHDGIYFFGLNADGNPDPASNDRGLLCMNHEAAHPFNVRTGENNLYIHANGATTTVTGAPADPSTDPPTPDTRVATRTVPDEVVKEINTHGVSIVEIRKADGVWTVVQDSPFNRRITGSTVMDITGPLRSHPALITRFSPDATRTQGTINNCANGYTPWGTYLTCEENWAGYFARAADDDGKRTRAGEVDSLKRYGNRAGALQRLNWDTAGSDDNFARWNTSVIGTSADGSDDFRNAIQQFGYVVEIDPYSPQSVPAKRTALGRLAHEGCWPAPVVPGQPLVFYMGDDNRGDYIYKFVTDAVWDPADAYPADRMATGAKYLDAGTLYVARFNADGSGDWLPLRGADDALDTRLAGDAAGATRMDRPEWAAVNPQTGEVYMTLTNSNASNRLVAGTPGGNAALTDAANPRAYSDAGNPNGHIIRWREDGDFAPASSFRWDIYLFGARESADPVNVNVSSLTDVNDFSSPDGLWFGRPGNPATGLLWIQTDDGAYTDVTNCMMLAAVPGVVGDGAPRQITSTSGSDSRTVTSFAGDSARSATLRRFLVGPRECEITGIDSTPDGRTLFVNIQHPGEETPPDFADPTSYGSHWPDSQTNPASVARPRSATIVITRADGGVIGL